MITKGMARFFLFASLLAVFVYQFFDRTGNIWPSMLICATLWMVAIYLKEENSDK